VYEDGCLVGCSAVKTGSPDDGGSTDLCNVGKLIPAYTALQPRIQPSPVVNIVKLENAAACVSNVV
jgi:hypothetical protein